MPNVVSIDPLELSRDANEVSAPPITVIPATTILPSACTATAPIVCADEKSTHPSVSKLRSGVPSVLNLATMP